MFIDNQQNTEYNIMSGEVDILENDVREKYPHILEILLLDHSTKKNIIWATDNYKHLGKDYDYNSQILPNLITGVNGEIIMPRASKNKLIQQSRVRDMAEVFTPSWICNAQNNLIDNAWFGYENVFNIEMTNSNGSNIWQTKADKIVFPKDKTWQDYIKETRLEITCGEAPYLASRYDTTTGVFIPVENRIGLLDRKMRIINENVETIEDWLEATELAFKNIYAYEWHGDSLLLAREALLFTFIENHVFKFDKEPTISSIKKIANIISWNAWQMDGLKGVVPNSCSEVIQEIPVLFEETKTIKTPCEGCVKNNIKKHNGIYCIIMDWVKTDKIKIGYTFMKFDAIVGNPPYQKNISSSSNNASLSKQLFPDFVKISISLKADYLSLITPSRWFTGVAQDKSFIKLRKFIKENNHIVKIVNYPNSGSIFPNVSISGGVNYFLYSPKHNGNVEFAEFYNEKNNITTNRPLFEEGLDIILNSSKNYKIIQKVKKDNFISMTTITKGRDAFGIVGKDANDVSETNKQKGFYELRCRYEEIRYVDKKFITKNIDIANKWKIFISKGNGGAGLLTDNNEVAILGKPYIGKPFSACTDSLIPIGCFDSEFEANALISYIKSKFLRYVVGLLKVSQAVSQNVYQFVPLQNFTPKSDIDWTKSIANIDQQLYKKYKLTKDEIEIIESKLKVME